jgi:hypothetical protein
MLAGKSIGQLSDDILSDVYSYEDTNGDHYGAHSNMNTRINDVNQRRQQRKANRNQNPGSVSLPSLNVSQQEVHMTDDASMGTVGGSQRLAHMMHKISATSGALPVGKQGELQAHSHSKSNSSSASSDAKKTNNKMQLESMEDSASIKRGLANVLMIYDELNLIVQDLFYRKDLSTRVQVANEAYLVLFQSMMGEVLSNQRDRFRVDQHELHETKQTVTQLTQDLNGKNATIQEIRERVGILDSITMQQNFQLDTKTRELEKLKADIAAEEHRKLMNPMQYVLANFGPQVNEFKQQFKREFDELLAQKTSELKKKLEKDKSQFTLDRARYHKKQLDDEKSKRTELVQQELNNMIRSGKFLPANNPNANNEEEEEIEYLDIGTQTECDEQGLWDLADGWVLPLSHSEQIRKKWRTAVAFACCPNCRGVGKYVAPYVSTLVQRMISTHKYIHASNHHHHHGHHGANHPANNTASITGHGNSHTNTHVSTPPIGHNANRHTNTPPTNNHSNNHSSHGSNHPTNHANTNTNTSTSGTNTTNTHHIAANSNHPHRIANAEPLSLHLHSHYQPHLRRGACVWTDEMIEFMRHLPKSIVAERAHTSAWMAARILRIFDLKQQTHLLDLLTVHTHLHTQTHTQTQLLQPSTDTHQTLSMAQKRHHVCRQTLADFMMEYFLFTSAGKRHAELSLYRVLHAIGDHHNKHPLLQLFARMLGVLNSHHHPHLHATTHTFNTSTATNTSTASTAANTTGVNAETEPKEVIIMARPTPGRNAHTNALTSARGMQQTDTQSLSSMSSDPGSTSSRANNTSTFMSPDRIAAVMHTHRRNAVTDTHPHGHTHKHGHHHGKQSLLTASDVCLFDSVFLPAYLYLRDCLWAGPYEGIYADKMRDIDVRTHILQRRDHLLAQFNYVHTQHHMNVHSHNNKDKAGRRNTQQQAQTTQQAHTPHTDTHTPPPPGTASTTHTHNNNVWVSGPIAQSLPSHILFTEDLQCYVPLDRVLHVLNAVFVYHNTVQTHTSPPTNTQYGQSAQTPGNPFHPMSMQTPIPTTSMTPPPPDTHNTSTDTSSLHIDTDSIATNTQPGGPNTQPTARAPTTAQSAADTQTPSPNLYAEAFMPMDKHMKSSLMRTLEYDCRYLMPNSGTLNHPEIMHITVLTQTRRLEFVNAHKHLLGNNNKTNTNINASASADTQQTPRTDGKDYGFTDSLPNTQSNTPLKSMTPLPFTRPQTNMSGKYPATPANTQANTTQQQSSSADGTNTHSCAYDARDLTWPQIEAQIAVIKAANKATKEKAEYKKRLFAYADEDYEDDYDAEEEDEMTINTANSANTQQTNTAAANKQSQSEQQQQQAQVYPSVQQINKDYDPIVLFNMDHFLQLCMDELYRRFVHLEDSIVALFHEHCVAVYEAAHATPVSVYAHENTHGLGHAHEVAHTPNTHTAAADAHTTTHPATHPTTHPVTHVTHPNPHAHGHAYANTHRQQHNGAEDGLLSFHEFEGFLYKVDPILTATLDRRTLLHMYKSAHNHQNLYAADHHTAHMHMDRYVNQNVNRREAVGINVQALLMTLRANGYIRVVSGVSILHILMRIV